MKNNLILAFIILSNLSVAQVITPQPSPKSTLNQTVGITEIEISYSRPGVKGRKVFGDLVPYDKFWRTGANSATQISINKPIVISGTELLKGSYALLIKPSKNQWLVNFYTYVKGDWKFYKDQTPVVSTSLDTKPLSEKVESFTIDITDFTDNGAHLEIKWENTLVGIPFEVKTAEQVENQIERFSKNPLKNVSNDYYKAASYNLSVNKDLNLALEWINEAVKIRPEAYWMLGKKAEIEVALGMQKEALDTYEKSTALATKANSLNFVAQNNKAVAAIKKAK